MSDGRPDSYHSIVPVRGSELISIKLHTCYAHAKYHAVELSRRSGLSDMPVKDKCWTDLHLPLATCIIASHRYVPGRRSFRCSSVVARSRHTKLWIERAQAAVLSSDCAASPEPLLQVEHAQRRLQYRVGFKLIESMPISTRNCAISG